MNSIRLMNSRIPVRNNIIELDELEDDDDGRIPLLVYINNEAYVKLIRKAAIEGLDQDEIVERLILLLDDKHRSDEILSA